MPDPAPLLPDEPGLQGGGTFPTQVHVATGNEPMANMEVLEKTGDILLWLGDSMITVSNILLSYMEPRELQLFILSYSANRLGYKTEAPNLFSEDGSIYTSENSLWIEDVINGNPVQFVKQGKVSAAPPSTQGPSSNIQRPEIPVFRPSNVPVFSRRTD